MAAYYGAATGNPFASSTGTGGTTGSSGAASSHPSYAYYNNYMASAFYPHTAAASGYVGYGSGAGATGPQLPTHPSTTGQQAIYHLNNSLPPPSISEPGVNPLDDIVKCQNPGK